METSCTFDEMVVMVKRRKLEIEEECQSESQSQRRWWEGLSPEILALIFVRVVPVDELMRTVPFVCKGWHDAVAGPYCWSEVDVDQWSRRVGSTSKTDSAVRNLVRRSDRSLRRLCAYKLGNDGFAFAASSGKLLKVLQITMSEVSDGTVKKHIRFLHLLTVLDISYCLCITSRGIELVGQNCRCLVQLRRNMPPPQPEVSQHDNGASSKVDESEAMAVANTMRGIEHLELAYGRFSDRGLDAILTKCVALRILDIRGCWNVKLEGNIEDRCGAIPSFKNPWYDQYQYEDPSSGDEEDDLNQDHPLDVAIAAADDNGGDGGQVDVVVISDDEDDVSVVHVDDD